MELNELTKLIINKAILVHKELGPGLYEEVYQECLYHELTLSRLMVEKEGHVPVCYKGIIFKHAYKADLVVNDSVIIELKAQEQLTSSTNAAFNLSSLSFQTLRIAYQL